MQLSLELDTAEMWPVGWADGRTHPLSWSDRNLGPLGYLVMVRAPWDPMERPRTKGEGGARRLRSLGAVLERRDEELCASLRTAWQDIHGEDPVQALGGVTLHGLVMAAYGGRWGGDVVGGTTVERALWRAYSRSEWQCRLCTTPEPYRRYVIAVWRPRPF